MTTCTQCPREIENPKPGQRFCSANCRAAHHRQHGKAASGKVQGIHPVKGGGCVVVVRVPAEEAHRPRAWSPGQAVELLARDLSNQGE